MQKFMSILSELKTSERSYFVLSHFSRLLMDGNSDGHCSAWSLSVAQRRSYDHSGVHSGCFSLRCSDFHSSDLLP